MAQALLDSVRNTVSDAVGSLLAPPWLKDNGGVGQTPDSETDTWSTAEALMLGSKMLDIAPWFPNLVSAAAVESMKQWLLKLQRPDGSWPTYERTVVDAKGDVLATSLALLTLHRWSNDNAVKQAARDAITWLANARNADQGWSVADSRFGTNKSTAFPTIFAYEAITVWKQVAVGDIRLMLEVGYGAKGFLRSIRKGSLLAESVEQPDPTPRHTAYEALVSKSVGGFDLNEKEIVRWLKRVQGPNGMWLHEGKYDIESTAIGVRALLALGVDPREKVIIVAVGALLGKASEGTTNRGQKYVGWPETPGGSPMSYLSYYSLMALLDYYSAMRSRKSAFPHRLKGKGLRKYASAGLLFLAGCGFLSAMIWAADNFKVVAGALSTLVAIAAVVVAIPPLAHAWRSRK